MRYQIWATNCNVEGECLGRLVSGMRGSREREESEKLVGIMTSRNSLKISWHFERARFISRKCSSFDKIEVCLNDNAWIQL